jgi:hypothetical protein
MDNVRLHLCSLFLDLEEGTIHLPQHHQQSSMMGHRDLPRARIARQYPHAPLCDHLHPTLAHIRGFEWDTIIMLLWGSRCTQFLLLNLPDLKCLYHPQLSSCLESPKKSLTKLGELTPACPTHSLSVQSSRTSLFILIAP